MELQLTMQFMLILVIVSAILRNVTAEFSRCIVPEVMGEMVEVHKRYRIIKGPDKEGMLTDIKYIKVNAGTFIPDIIPMQLICNEGYFVKVQGEISAPVQCKSGQWIPDPLCVKDIAEDIIATQAHDSKDMHLSQEKDIISNECTIPPIENGEVGIFKTTAKFLYERHQRFVTLNEGDVISHGEKAYLICDDTFTPYQDVYTRRSTSICNNGTWTRHMECLPTACPVNPPTVENTHLLSAYENRDHGERAEYKCKSGYKQVKESTVVCEFGAWKGETPKCEKLNKDPCLGDPPTARRSDPVITGRNHGDYVFYKCHEGLLPVQSGWLVCDYGKWMGKLPECIPSLAYRNNYMNEENMEDFSEIRGHHYRKNLGVESDSPAVEDPEEDYDLTTKLDEESEVKGKDTHGIKSSQKKPMGNSSCSEEPPIVENADSKVENRSHGSLMWYKCHKGYKKVKHGNVTCTDGVWKGPKPVCVLKSETSCLADPPDVANADAYISSRTHGSIIWYKCRVGFSKAVQGDVQCDTGFWKGKLPECREISQYGSKQLQGQMRQYVGMLPEEE